MCIQKHPLPHFLQICQYKLEQRVWGLGPFLLHPQGIEQEAVPSSVPDMLAALARNLTRRSRAEPVGGAVSISDPHNADPHKTTHFDRPELPLPHPKQGGSTWDCECAVAF